MQISRIRLSDKTSRLHPRHVVPKPAQAYEPEVPVEVREWISPALASPDLVLGTQPPTQPHSCVVVERPNVHGRRAPRREHTVLMEHLGRRLREHARGLGFSDAEIARR